MKEEYSGGSYYPGQCNIGQDEVRRRMRTGYLGLVLMLVCILLLELLNAEDIYKLLLFVPAVIAFSGFFQAVQKFCFLYGFRGVSSMPGRRKFSRITDTTALKKDLRLALKLVLQVVLASALVAVLYYFISETVRE